MARLLFFTVGVIVALALRAFGSEPRTAAMWVYQTDALVESPADVTELIGFCRQRRIADLFWATHFPRVEKGSAETRIPDSAALRRFLSEARAAHIKVHALAGDPSDILPENRARAVGRIDAVVRFNQTGPAFAGIHLDIEPHAQPSWKMSSAAERSALLTQMVEVHAAGARRLHELAPGLVYGADVVFWLGKKDADGSAAYPVRLEGVEADAEVHLLGLVDHLALMSYRGFAEGRNGVIELVRGTMARADHGRAKVFVGLKMASIGPPLEGFHGRSEAEMQQAVAAIEGAFGEHANYAGVAYFMYSAYREMAR
jgi:hypothetical protein